MKKIILIFLLLAFAKNSSEQPVWNIQNSGTTNNLNKIYWDNGPLGLILFIVGDNGTILRSTNHGLKWVRVNSNTSSNLYSMHIRSLDTGYAVGSNGVMIKTVDGGESWNLIASLTSNTLRGINITNSNIAKVIVAGDNGTFLKLSNNIWTTAQIDTSNLNSITYESGASQMWAVGNSGTVLRSTNYGLNWNRIITNVTHNLNYVSSTSYFVIGDQGTAFRISGNNINFIYTGTLNNLYGLDPAANVLMCGSNGTVLYNDNNSGFRPIYINTNLKLNSIIKIGDKCFAVGENGIIFHTDNINISPRAKQINSNNISTWFLSNGIFNRHPSGSQGFEWPKGEMKYARYASGFVIGSIVNGDTLVTVCDYSSEYLPGYTNNIGQPMGNGSSEYRIYKMVYGINDSDRIYWPNEQIGNSNQGAPVYFDSVSNLYKPNDYGNQTMFYSYTDSYDSSHRNYAGRTVPLKVDIKQINYSFNQPEDLKNIIYQEYRIINRSTNSWTNAYINLWTDDDLGSATDDAEGVDTNINLAYTYNFTSEDWQYGTNPPAVGFAVIRAPLTYTGNNNDTVFYYEGKRKRIKVGYKEIDLGSTAIYHDDSNQPTNYRESYNAIRGLKNDGSQYINPVTDQPTRFVYSGDPVTGIGWICPSTGDMRFYQGFGPMNINPGDTQVIVIAQVIARGSSNLNSITKLREASTIAKQYYDNCFEGITIGINNITQNVPESYSLSQNFPNPFNPTTNLEFGISNLGFVSLKVFDVLGKEVATIVNEKKNAGKYSVTFDGSNFASGVYFYSLFLDGEMKDTKRMMLIK